MYHHRIVGKGHTIWVGMSECSKGFNIIGAVLFECYCLFYMMTLCMYCWWYVFVKMLDSCCRAYRLSYAMDVSGLAGDGFANALVKSFTTSIVRSAEDEMGIVKLKEN